MPRPRTRASPHRLLLLRTPAEESADCPYRQALERTPHELHRWTLASVQVLDTHYANGDVLLHHLTLVHSLDDRRSPPYDGIVITSARAVDAYRTQLARIQPRPPPPRIPLFVVGQPTAAALDSLPLPSRPDPALVLGARESGTGESLARFILAHFATTRTSTRPVTLLYLTGDKNRDTLPRLLAEGGIHTRELQVYATAPAASFPSALADALHPATADGEGGLVWLALFSPSSAREALSTLASLSLPTHVRARLRLVAIGPVTARFIAEAGYGGVRVSAVAERPEPEGLLRAVFEATAREEAGRAEQGEVRGV